MNGHFSRVKSMFKQVCVIFELIGRYCIHLAYFGDRAVRITLRCLTYIAKGFEGTRTHFLKKKSN